MTAAIEVAKLVQVVWVSLVAGVGSTALASLVIYGWSRAGEASREGRSAQAGAFAALALLAGLAVAALVGLGLAIIVRK